MWSRWSVLAFCLTVLVTLLCIRFCFADEERMAPSLLHTVNPDEGVVPYVQHKEGENVYERSSVGVKVLQVRT